MQPVTRSLLRLSLFWLSLFTVLSGQLVRAQETTGNVAAQEATVPRLIQFGGVLKDAVGRPLAGVQGVTFALYREPEGGSPLWLETQNVTADAEGRFAVLLGATKGDGVPLDLFASGESRWLGVQANQPGEAEQPRVLLVSVPYALKAADAETLGGKPLSAFVLTDSGPGLSDSNGTSSADKAPPQSDLSQSTAAISGTGTTNKVAKWTDGPNGVLGDSDIFNSNGNVGIGTTNPTQPLTVVKDQNGSTAIGVGNLDTGNVALAVLTATSTDGNLNLFSAGAGYTGLGFVPHLGDSGVIQAAAGLSGGLHLIAQTANAPMRFYTGGIAAANERMRIDGSGNVGIGATNPAQKLEVAGNVKVTGTPGTNGIIFPDSTTQTTAMRTAALTRAITYLAGCEWCGTLADSYDQPKIFYNLVGPMTINSVTCFSDTGTPVINVGKNGSNILSSNLTCSTSGSSTTSFSNNALNSFDTLDFVMVTAGGAAHRVTVTIQATIN